MGFTRIAHTTAIGKVLLASAPDADLDDYLQERRLVPYTRRTLVERRHIKRHLRVVRERGIGKDLEELADGCCCVAVPVLDGRGADGRRDRHLHARRALAHPRGRAHRAVLRDRRARLQRPARRPAREGPVTAR